LIGTIKLSVHHLEVMLLRDLKLRFEGAGNEGLVEARG